MRGNARRDTKPELAVRRLVHASGLRYRVDFAPLSEMRRRKADLVFTRAKVAVFVDGCFWHGCPRHYRKATTNADYWVAKVRANQARDTSTDLALSESGWTVLRFWEHEQPDEVARKVISTVRALS